MWWEHWKKKIYDQENIIDFFITPPPKEIIKSIYLMRKQQEVNRTDTVGYKNREKVLHQFILPKKKEHSRRGKLFLT